MARKTIKSPPVKSDAAGKPESRSLPKHIFTLLGRINWALIISILSFVLSLVSLYLVEAQNKYTNLFLPFTYSAVRKEPAALHYTIASEEGTMELPAYETVFHVETGSCDAFYIIGYNGDDAQTTINGTSLKTQDSPGYYLLSSGPAPYDSVPDTCRRLYDFFFVYTESASGEASLSLFYYRIDLDNQTVEGPIRMNAIELLNSKARQNDYLFHDMCLRYEELLQKIDSLPVMGGAEK